MRKTIHVTQQDIEAGLASTANDTAPAPTCCPIAQAIIRQMSPEDVRVGGFGLITVDGHEGMAPPAARKFIKDFDRLRFNPKMKGQVHPFSFRLELK